MNRNARLLLAYAKWMIGLEKAMHFKYGLIGFGFGITISEKESGEKSNEE